jgi:hypothetical protein
VRVVGAALLALLCAASVATASRPRAPILAGTTLTGASISLAQFRGRPVLVNVWSSW